LQVKPPTHALEPFWHLCCETMLNNFDGMPFKSARRVVCTCLSAVQLAPLRRVKPRQRGEPCRGVPSWIFCICACSCFHSVLSVVPVADREIRIDDSERGSCCAL
jgi:hypothetical protein